MWPALLIFAFTYLLILGRKLPLLSLDRPSGAVVGAVAMVAAGVLTPEEVYGHAVNYDTILLLLGMMILSAYLAEAGFFRWASWGVIRTARTPRRLLAAITLVSAALSALLVNDTICLMVTPLVLQVADDADLPPLPYLFAVAFGANAGSAATPTGNPQNMIVATLSQMSWLEFTLALAPATVVATLVVLGLLLLLFRRDLEGKEIAIDTAAAPTVDRRLLAKAVLASLGVVAGFLWGFNLAWTAMAGAAFLLATGGRPSRPVLARVDWVLLLFFAGLFVVVHGVGVSGAGTLIFESIGPLTTGSRAWEATKLALVSVVGSNLFSNVPFVMLAAQWMPSFSDPTRAWQILALSSTLAGNLTLVGSVANLIVFELAGARGRIPFFRFLAYGLPITLLSTAAGTAVLLALQG